jgi:hypothetical protein
VAALSVLAMAADRQTLLDQQDNAWWGREMIDKSLFFFRTMKQLQTSNFTWCKLRFWISRDVRLDLRIHTYILDIQQPF